MLLATQASRWRALGPGRADHRTSLNLYQLPVRIFTFGEMKRQRNKIARKGFKCGIFLAHRPGGPSEMELKKSALVSLLMMLLLPCASAFHHQAVTLRRRHVELRAVSEEGAYGVLGSAASCVVLWSEFTLKTTGCGLPAGPFGALGALEGISYLTIIGIIGASLSTKLKTGKGLPSGPGGLLGAAEGLSYLAAAVGIVVLGLQINDYGYVPNAVPIEGGKCS